MDFYYPLILDGATGTQLQKRGFEGGISAEQWVLEHPEALAEFQNAYIEAGSNIIYAPTFGANRVRMEENGVRNLVEEWNYQLVQLSKQTAAGRALVAGDLAPTGFFLPPMGDTTFEEIVDIYREQVRGLEKGGVDLYVIETMTSLVEARAALLAVKEISKKPVLVSFTCSSNGKTLDGTDMTAVLVTIQNMGADIFGLNCSEGPDGLTAQLKRLSPYAEVPLAAKPNAGLPEFINGKAVYRCDPEVYTDQMEAMAEAGVCIFGGCCGSTEDHIAAMAKKAPTLTMRQPSPISKDQLSLATGKDLFLLSPDTSIGRILPCNDDLADELEEEMESADTLIAVRIDSEDQLETFEEVQGSIRKPLCLLCDDAALLEKALRMYQGRCMYQGSLPEEVLTTLQKKYGLVW